MRPRQIIDEAERRGGTVKNEGSVANLGKPLEAEGVITRTASGWVLKAERLAPLLVDGFAWGPLSGVFNVQEIAAHRRQLILHVLGLQPSGLQQAQLLATLESCAWLNGVPVNKDLIKLDIETMAKAGLVRRVGPSSKWEVTPV